LIIPWRGGAVKKNRIFSEKELKEMGRVTKEVALEAVEAGDKKKAKECINRMGEESIFSHDADKKKF
jgi:hypothetical protein